MSDKLKSYIASVDTTKYSKEERSKFYKATAKKFGVSWQTVVGVYLVVKKNPNSASKKPTIEVPIAVYREPKKNSLAESLRQSLEQQKATLVKEIKDSFSAGDKAAFLKKAHDYKANFKNETKKDSLLEIAIPDLHIGKHSWGKETGEDYDIKIAVDRYTKAVDELLSRTNLEQVDRILLPVGNDMINIDNKVGTTTGGTPQSVDSRFGKMFQTAKNLLIRTVDKLSTIAPVDVVIVAGNHDNVTMFTLGEVLDAYYHLNPNVTVNNSPKQRKYYKYGQNGLMFTHGNEEKHNELGLIFATEEAKLWSDVKFREVQLGHFHKTKRTDYTSIDEFQGFKVRVIPSLSGTDSWHYQKGYNSQKSAQAFLFHKDKGLIAEFTHTV